MPPHDAEPVLHGGDQSVSVEAPVILAGDGYEARGSGAHGGHLDQRIVDLVEIVDEVWSRGQVASGESDPFGAARFEVELPVSAAGREQRVPDAEVADWLSIGPSAASSGEVEQHEPLAERR